MCHVPISNFGLQKLIRSNKTKEAAEMVMNGARHEIPAR